MLSCPGKSWNLYGIYFGIYGKIPWKILESPGISVSNLAGNHEKTDRKMWQKDRQRKIVRNIKSRSL